MCRNRYSRSVYTVPRKNLFLIDICCLFICASIYLSTYQPIYLSNCLLIYLSIHLLSIYIFIYQAMQSRTPYHHYLPCYFVHPCSSLFIQLSISPQLYFRIFEKKSTITKYYMLKNNFRTTTDLFDLRNHDSIFITIITSTTIYHIEVIPSIKLILSLISR